MNPNDTAALGALTVAVPSLLGLLWPHFITFALIAAFLAFSCLFLVFKRRNQAK